MVPDLFSRRVGQVFLRPNATVDLSSMSEFD